MSWEDLLDHVKREGTEEGLRWDANDKERFRTAFEQADNLGDRMKHVADKTVQAFNAVNSASLQWIRIQQGRPQGHGRWYYLDIAMQERHGDDALLARQEDNPHLETLANACWTWLETFENYYPMYPHFFEEAWNNNREYERLRKQMGAVLASIARSIERMQKASFKRILLNTCSRQRETGGKRPFADWEDKVLLREYDKTFRDYKGRDALEPRCVQMDCPYTGTKEFTWVVLQLAHQNFVAISNEAT